MTHLCLICNTEMSCREIACPTCRGGQYITISSDNPLVVTDSITINSITPNNLPESNDWLARVEEKYRINAAFGPARVQELEATVQEACELLDDCLEWYNGGEQSAYDKIVAFINKHDRNVGGKP